MLINVLFYFQLIVSFDYHSIGLTNEIEFISKFWIE